ncbi:phage gp6-like head-tail connector protein [Lysinibacillus fusiformis]|uniref:head-tail connector protein n=1 Tax=Lysinibacillus fusiformis TaxID=28031 RepID=UPI0019670B26|nr:head-tail connector protein [Lysinibacillus fusiformis]QSB10448.1 phage gp6-like head-tail connector protein [Lysinibacillus fusiformis]
MENKLTLLEKVKFAMRLDEDEHDDELNDLIAAAKREIIEVGASSEKVVDEDDLIRRACILYCKAHFGYDDNKERFASAFEKMLIKLSLLSSFKGDSNEL